MRRLTPALGALLVAALPAHAAEGGPAHRESYGTKAPYAAVRQNPHGYRKAPAGFVPVFTENVSRLERCCGRSRAVPTASGRRRSPRRCRRSPPCGPR